MKIENGSIHSLASSRPQSTTPVDRSSHAGENIPASSSKDRAELSEQARMLAKARSALNETPEVQNERIEQLRQQIEAGTYTIPFEALAGHLLKLIK
ncbi:MAG: flagellar biosynthesis anti-sigma factor FlgM [Thermanaerothrix sp.]|nr:flagellar biosynthesis anti-sigma factor FlgM [Thermanaerothrix sp.]